MFSAQFLKPFLVLEVFFQNFHFLTPLTPLFWNLLLRMSQKPSKKISPFGGCGTCLVPNFWSPFGFWGIFSKFSFFDPFNPPFLKKLKILTFLKILFGGIRGAKVPGPWVPRTQKFFWLCSFTEIFSTINNLTRVFTGSDYRYFVPNSVFSENSSQFVLILTNLTNSVPILAHSFLILTISLMFCSHIVPSGNPESSII